MQNLSVEQVQRTKMQRFLEIAVVGLKVVFCGPGACVVTPTKGNG